ncbi:sulfotransferase family protein [Pseudooceanicola nanhaiensis]|uniref:sulfotransferase family protein n=1 Tax=Pseudooceanicola nanhaiensis TaxID=375761 RepID=UPI001CD253DD|nr:sulfotransferase family protein [Pseudooceanicola nanhaiensis]MCA0922770.1 sulfotransferase family protein [Pseudooceanicola nanhaiensis]
MSKTLYIHIGHYKTGTTALQIFFDEETELLTEAGVEYPRVRFYYSKHSDFAFSILRAAGVEKMMYDYTNPTPPQEMWDELYAHIRESTFDTTLISSEEFIRLGQFDRSREILKQMLARKPDDLEIKVVAYLRSPGAHLRSWYNQLIKMNHPVPDLNAAVMGEIEEIHYDYRHALEPWVEALGAENVIVRPYRHDRKNPAALHQDFMKIFGVDLPARRVRHTTDPNPRLDDRVIELVRMMQNSKFPRPTINAILSQADLYFAQQDEQVVRKPDQMAAARAAAAEGLDWLAELPGGAPHAEHFRRNLPQPVDPAEVELYTMIGFVFSELILLRQRINRMNPEDMTERVSRLEKQLTEISAKI